MLVLKQPQALPRTAKRPEIKQLSLFSPDPTSFPLATPQGLDTRLSSTLSRPYSISRSVLSPRSFDPYQSKTPPVTAAPSPAPPQSATYGQTGAQHPTVLCRRVPRTLQYSADGCPALYSTLKTGAPYSTLPCRRVPQPQFYSPGLYNTLLNLYNSIVLNYTI